MTVCDLDANNVEGRMKNEGMCSSWHETHEEYMIKLTTICVRKQGSEAALCAISPQFILL